MSAIVGNRQNNNQKKNRHDHACTTVLSVVKSYEASPNPSNHPDEQVPQQCKQKSSIPVSTHPGRPSNVYVTVALQPVGV